MTTPSEQRRAASSAAASETSAQNSANAATNTATNAGTSALLSTLPGPLSAAAMALSEGISAAIKTSAAQAKSVPATAPSLADPTKIFASQLAYAIITAIWCFIKSILNPLPIIGMFFPLCSEEERLRNVTALANANITPVSSVSTPPSATSAQDSAVDQTATTGISFEQFLAAQSQAQSGRVVSAPRQPTQRQATSQTTTPVVPVAPRVQEVGRSSTNNDAENLAANTTDVRKLFGL